MKTVFLICIAVVCNFTGTNRNAIDFPVPPHTKKSLFYIHRSPNIHTVVYDVNLLKNNTIDPNDPVKVYWIRFGEKNKYKDLNYMEKTFAYGVKCESLGNARYRAQFVAKKEKSMDVYLDEKGQATAIMKVNGKMSKLIKMFVQVAEEGWWPKVAYVEFFGTELKTNLPTYEKLIIN